MSANSALFQPTRRPVILLLALFICSGLALVAWSHQHWETVQGDAVVPLDQLAQMRRLTLDIELTAEQLRDGEVSIEPAQLLAATQRARQALSNLRGGSGQLGALTSHRVPRGELAAAISEYSAAFEEFSTKIQQFAVPVTVDNDRALDVRALQSPLDAAATQVEAQLLKEIESQRQTQYRLSITVLVSVGGISLVFLWLLTRLEHRRQRAFAELAESEAHLKAFAAAVPDLSFVLDRTGYYRGVYSSTSNLLAAPQQSLIGRSMLDVLPAEDAEAFLAVIQHALDENCTQHYEYEMVLAGERRCFEARVAPIVDNNCVVWISWEITDRKQAERRVKKLTRLYNMLSEVNQNIVRVQGKDALLQRICDIAVRIGGFSCAWVGWLDEPARQLLPRVWAGTLPAPTEALIQPVDADGMTRWCYARPRDVAELGASDSAPVWIEAAAAQNLHGHAGIPLLCQERVVGLLNLLSEHFDANDPEETALLGEVGIDVSYALTSIARDAEHRLGEQRSQLLAAALESTRDGVVVMTANHQIVSVNRAFTDMTGTIASSWIGGPLDRLWPQDTDTLTARVWQPLSSRGFWEGEVELQPPHHDAVSGWISLSPVQDSANDVSHYVAVLSDITRLKRSEDQLRTLAYYDSLTGLPNRHMIGNRLEQALAAAAAHGGRAAVLFIDLDHFKQINDGLGHLVGDFVLAEVARRLSQHIRREDILGRQSGDEFILIIEHLRGNDDATIAALRLLGALKAPTQIENAGEIYLQASIGISVYPEDGTTAAELIRNADAAMYRAKAAGRNGFRFYNRAMTDDAQARLILDTTLRHAITHREFALFYQPQLDAVTERIIGLEALVRLPAPEGGFLAPDQFIPLMESSGLIMPLGEWVLHEACRQGRAWLDAGLQLPRLAVNVSAVEIRHGDIAAKLQRVLEETGFPAQRLEIEITESSLMAHTDDAATTLQALRKLGVRLALDDFGIGYSSLSYLRRFQFDTMKIDRSFIRDLVDDPGDRQLVITMIAMAHGLAMRVIAEGVETRPQLDLLRTLHCDEFQGFLYSAALPAEQIAALLIRPRDS
jgi:diguanylate cyclase (GGDEF)-like protein/PAS domain S-box-containing protein